jgi:hypothetical protein
MTKKPGKPDDWIPMNKKDGEFIIWSQKTTDFVLEGIYNGKEPGRYGDNHVIIVPDIGPVKFSDKLALLKELDAFHVGEPVRILHEGMVSGKNGREYRSFLIFRKSERQGVL